MHASLYSCVCYGVNAIMNSKVFTCSTYLCQNYVWPCTSNLSENNYFSYQLKLHAHLCFFFSFRGKRTTRAERTGWTAFIELPACTATPHGSLACCASSREDRTRSGTAGQPNGAGTSVSIWFWTLQFSG